MTPDKNTKGPVDGDETRRELEQVFDRLTDLLSTATQSSYPHHVRLLATCSGKFTEDVLRHLDSISAQISESVGKGANTLNMLRRVSKELSSAAHNLETGKSELEAVESNQKKLQGARDELKQKLANVVDARKALNDFERQSDEITIEIANLQTEVQTTLAEQSADVTLGLKDIGNTNKSNMIELLSQIGKIETNIQELGIQLRQQFESDNNICIGIKEMPRYSPGDLRDLSNYCEAADSAVEELEDEICAVTGLNQVI